MRISERIRVWYHNRETRNKTSQYLSIEQSSEDYTKGLLSRIERCIKESISYDSRLISTAIRGHKYLGNLLLTPIQSSGMNEEKLKQIIADISMPQFRLIESLKLLEDSLFLGLSGRYTAGFSTMRTALECMVVGGFYHGLSQPRLRTRANKIRNWGNKYQRYPKPFLEMVEDMIGDNTSHIGDGLYCESLVEEMLSGHNPPLQPPNFRRMVSQIVEWFGIKAIEDPVKAIADDLYETLSIFTHAMQDATSYKQALLSKEQEFLMMSGVVINEILVRFFKLYVRVLDIIGSLFFSFIQERLKTLKWETPVLLLLGDSYTDGKSLRNTTNAIFDSMRLLRMEKGIEKRIRKIIFPPAIKSLDELETEKLQIRYREDKIRVDLVPSLRMIFIEIRLWKSPIWDVFKMGLQFFRESDEVYTMVGICRGTRFERKIHVDFFVEQLDRIAVKIVDDLITARGQEYQDTISIIQQAYIHDSPLTYHGTQTWEVDWEKFKDEAKA